MRKRHPLRLLAAAAALALTLGTARAVRWEVDCADPDGGTPVSPLLYGLFLEDINHALDGGLYAEMIRNRSFEFGSLARNGARHGWTAQEGVVFDIVDGSADGTALNAYNPHYARITNTGGASAGILGCGYLDGFAVEAGREYTFSAFVRADRDPGEVTVSIRDTRGRVYAEAPLTGIRGVCGVGREWARYTLSLCPEESADRNLRVCLCLQPGASVDVDMVSLMPADTYAGLPVRKDLGEMLEAMHPAFLRFPGGCAVEGRNEESMYSWKASVGYGEEQLVVEVVPPQSEEDAAVREGWYGCDVLATGDISARPQGLDIWQGAATDPYYTTYGLGFYELFCLCEALGCEPVPVLNAGMTCPIQSPHYTVYPVNSDAFRQCVQDALDLAEFCRGGEDTRWGAVRVAMGHREPFPLTYIAIGNEQWQSEYYDHYLRFVEAFDRAAEAQPEIYGGIRLIVANGPAASSDEGWDYVEGYVGYEDTRTALVDEHFYMSPEWFLDHTDRYDGYDRGRPAKVFLGEYASQGNQLLNALAEAAFMTGLERNADVVAMACYAPLFGNAAANQWTPDLVFFNRNEAYGTANYWVQLLFMTNRPAVVLSDTAEACEGVYRTAGLSPEGDLVLKLVNATGGEVDIEAALTGYDPARWSDTAAVLTLRGERPADANTFGQPDRCAPAESALAAAETCAFTLPPWSLTVIRVPALTEQ